MGRPSVSKAAMSKVGTHFARSEPRQPFPQEFVELLESFPGGYGDVEPSQKRPRLDDHQDAIVIARGHLALNRRYNGSQPALEFRRRCLEQFFKLHFDLLVEGSRNTVKSFTLATLPRSEYGRYKFELIFGNVGQLTADLITILDVINRSRDTPGSDGAVFVSTHISFDRIEGEDYMGLDFELKWNESNNIYNGLRTPQQRKITSEVQKTFLTSPAELTSNGAGVLSAQAFYETAFITDESYSDLYSVTIPNLTSKLFPFQRRALQWLLFREGVRWNLTAQGGSPGLETCSNPSATNLAMSFKEMQDADGSPFYHSDLYHVITRDTEPWRDLECSLKGGILAEEMGLGKTVETISLILLHRRPLQPQIIFDPYTNQQVHTTSATLIVTPETLKLQWVSEIEKHAPTLRILVYEGRTKHKETEKELLQKMLENDIVVTTYNVLRSEIHFARPEPDRSRRHERTHSRASSPLVKLSWWRVCLDEAQQIESGVSTAAEVARLIPRVNAWGITGTPVKEKIKDLWGLLLFLRHEPFASYPVMWDALVSSHQILFRKLFNQLALRHTKHAVRHELVLPPQKRYVITMPFSAVEEQNYRTRFRQEIEALGLDISGTPLVPNEWDSNTPLTVDLMRRALASLRQTVLHPQLGPDRARVLGSIHKPLKTIDEVLDAMIEQTDIIIKTHQRACLISKLKQGQLLENSPRVREALTIWEEVLQEIKGLETECREQLRSEIETAGAANTETQHEINEQSDLEDDPEEQNIPPRVGEARRRLRTALDLKHRAIFFIASAYFQIKSKEDMTKPDSDDFKRLEKLEIDGYEKANQIRQEILQEVHSKASLYMTKLSQKANTQSFVDIPEFQCHLRAGLETRRHLEEYQELVGVLNEQAEFVDEWREEVIQLLLKPLVDQEVDEITGEEYENSTKIQDDLMVYTTILRAAISDRQDALSGLVNERTKHEVKIYKQQAKHGEGSSPEKFLELLALRDQVKPRAEHGSLRAVVVELRELATKLQGDTTDRSTVELRIVRELQKLIHEETTKQTKTNADLEKELNFFTSAMNARVEYYRQLQAVSDTVANWEREESDDDEALMRGLVDEAAKAQQKMEAAIATQRYQVHLKNQSQGPSKKTCPICTDTYTVGVLTPCTHEFCADCIKTWVAAHHRCPLCKKPISMANCHEVVVREPKLKLHKDQVLAPTHDPHVGESPQKIRSGGIYTGFSEDKLKEVNDAPLEGPALPTKLNALIRHLLWLRRTDAGAKSVIFSQYGAFLDILKRALDRYDIGFSSFATRNGITRFKEDPAIECFLMDARAHASGLNLVNANHVFLCEPLLNTALELQAIARVDRIGQKHETHVWLYLVEGTVEESIYNLSTKRRIEHMETTTKGKGKASSTPEILEDSLEVANSMELRHANLLKLMDKDTRLGEVVDKRDLWDCIFGHVATENDVLEPQTSSDPRFEDKAVRGFLAGRAAEERREAQERYQEERERQEASLSIASQQDRSDDDHDDLETDEE
ncbi:SNF2 family domain-containing protein [Seiridium cupressi]